MRLDDLPESGNIEDRRGETGYGGGGGFGLPIGGGGAQGRLDVALLDERRLALALEIFVLTIGPDTRKAVGLQLDLDLDVICFRLAAGNALRVLRLRQNTEQVLHVMTDFMGDHVGLRELA